MKATHGYLSLFIILLAHTAFAQEPTSVSNPQTPPPALANQPLPPTAPASPPPQNAITPPVESVTTQVTTQPPPRQVVVQPTPTSAVSQPQTKTVVVQQPAPTTTTTTVVQPKTATTVVQPATPALPTTTVIQPAPTTSKVVVQPPPAPTTTSTVVVQPQTTPTTTTTVAPATTVVPTQPQTLKTSEPTATGGPICGNKPNCTVTVNSGVAFLSYLNRCDQLAGATISWLQAKTFLISLSVGKTSFCQINVKSVNQSPPIDVSCPLTADDVSLMTSPDAFTAMQQFDLTGSTEDPVLRQIMAPIQNCVASAVKR